MTARRRQRPSQGATAVSRESERDGRSQGPIRRPGGKRPRWRHGLIDAAEPDDEGFNASSGKRRRRRKTGHAGLAGRLLVAAAPIVITTVHLAMISGHPGCFHWARRGRVHRMRRRRRDQRQSQRGGPDQKQGKEPDQARSSRWASMPRLPARLNDCREGHPSHAPMRPRGRPARGRATVSGPATVFRRPRSHR